MIELKETNDVNPICPHCSENITELWYQELSALWGRRYVYFCSQCKKVLGVSHRKGFWMG